MALATSAEVFAPGSAAHCRGVDELALAGVLGPSVRNGTTTLGADALVHPIHTTGIEWLAWLRAALPAVLVAYALVVKRVGRIGGAVLVATYRAYLALAFR